MEKLLKIAKALAIRTGDSTLQKKHLSEALKYVRIQNPSWRDRILNELALTPQRVGEIMLGGMRLIDEAESKPKLPLDAEVREIAGRMGMKESPYEVTGNPEEPAAASPAASVEIDPIALVRRLKKELGKLLFEQDEAIESLTDGLKRPDILASGLGSAPAGVFLFCGPSGCGKSFLAQRLAGILGEAWKTLTIDMTAYQSSNQGFGLIGSTTGYTDARPGELTSFVRENPQSVVVLDNIDKAHPNIQNVLLGMLNNGELKDQFGFYENNDPKKKKIAEPIVNFRKTIIILTTALGDTVYDNPSLLGMYRKDPQQGRKILQQALKDAKVSTNQDPLPAFAPEMLGRLFRNEILLFNKLSFQGLLQIARREWQPLREQFKSNFTVEVEHADSDLLLKLVILSLGPTADAGQITGQKLDHALFDPITDLWVAQKKTARARISVEENLAATLEKLIREQLGEGDPVKAMFRKNLMLRYRLETRIDGDTTIAHISAPEFKTVPKSSDIGSSGSIVAETPQIFFEQIAGHDIVKTRIKEAIRLLKKPQQLKNLGVDIPKGILLYGPPGTGKTMLAKAFATEAGLPFIATTGSEMLDLEFVKLLFQRARRYAPTVLFIDEIDALGRRGHGGYDRVINQILTEIDGFDGNEDAQVFIIAATNLKDKLDDALIRSGRIDLHIEVPTLDRPARAVFIKRYLEIPNDGSLQEETLITLTSGMTGADLEKVRRETVLEMVRQDLEQISMTMLIEQINTIRYGVRRTDQRLLDQLAHTAYHEAGHAVISRILNPDVRIEQVTVTPRANALGFAAFDGESSKYRAWTKKEVTDQICVALAGRVAQAKQFGEAGIDAGASSDLKMATAYARAAIAVWGLDSEIGLISVDGLPQPVADNLLNQNIETRISVWLKDTYAETEKLVGERWLSIVGVAKLLLEKETIDEKQLDDMIANH